MWNIKRKLRCSLLCGERAPLSLRYEKDVWVCGCFWLTKKHCGKNAGYKWIFSSETRLLVRPGKWVIRGITERWRMKRLRVSTNDCATEYELEFGGITITRVLRSGSSKIIKCVCAIPMQYRSSRNIKEDSSLTAPPKIYQSYAYLSVSCI